MRQSVVLIAVAALAAMVVALLFVHGTNEEGMRALRPNATAIYILWISFIIGFLRPGALYVVFIATLLFCGVVRWFPRTRETIA
ncbi:MAG TPA: hypothetical protein VEO54_12440 [Thermoanaerobaculia bacterium]|nr:hypothetical protein [Thermoanaerobaculia bacterium]